MMMMMKKVRKLGMIDMFAGAFIFFAGCLFMYIIMKNFMFEPEPVEIIKYVEVEKGKKTVIDEDSAKEKEWFN
jgi:hypothetical protein